MKKPPVLLYDLFSWVYKAFILFISFTSHVKVLNRDHYKKFASQKKPVIFAFWHENVISPPLLYFISVKGKNLVSLVSRSRDGEIISKILERFGGITVRGSSSRGGAVALIRMAEKIKEGWDGGMIPDGPKGPPLKIKPGVLKLAQLSSAPIIPCGIEYRRKIRLKTWDRMKIPLPFNRICLHFGDPIVIPASSNVADLAHFQEKLKAQLDASGEEAKKYVFRK